MFYYILGEINYILKLRHRRTEFLGISIRNTETLIGRSEGSTIEFGTVRSFTWQTLRIVQDIKQYKQCFSVSPKSLCSISNAVLCVSNGVHCSSFQESHL